MNVFLNWADQIGEMGMAVGIIALAAVFGLTDGDPNKRIEKVPMCRVECVVFDSAVECIGKTEDVWNDFLDREIAKSEHNYCGACGALVDCSKLRFK